MFSPFLLLQSLVDFRTFQCKDINHAYGQKLETSYFKKDRFPGRPRPDDPPRRAGRAQEYRPGDRWNLAERPTYQLGQFPNGWQFLYGSCVLLSPTVARGDTRRDASHCNQIRQNLIEPEKFCQFVICQNLKFFFKMRPSYAHLS